MEKIFQQTIVKLRKNLQDFESYYSFLNIALESKKYDYVFALINKLSSEFSDKDSIEILWDFFLKFVVLFLEREKNPLFRAEIRLKFVDLLMTRLKADEMALDQIKKGFNESRDPRFIELLLPVIKESLKNDELLKITNILSAVEEDPDKRSKIMEEREKLLLAKKQEINNLAEKIATTEDPREKSSLLLAMALSLREIEPASDEWIDIIHRSFTADHSNTEPVAKLEEFFGMSQNWSGLESLYRNWLETEETPEIKSHIHKLLGGLCLNRLSQPEKAASHFLESVSQNPSDRESFELIAKYYTRQNNFQGLIELHEKARKTAGSREEEKFHIEKIAAVLWKNEKNLEKAEKYFRILRAQDPKHLLAIEFYEDYFTEKEDWQKLFSTLSYKISVAAEDREKEETSLRMAEIAGTKLHNPDKAIESYRKALNINKDNLNAFEHLVSLYEKSAKWPALVELYNFRINSLPDNAVEEKVAVYFKIIEIYQDEEKLPSEEMVLQIYQKIISLSPSNLKALNLLAKSYHSKERWSDLLSILQKKVEYTSDGEELLDLFNQIAEIYITRMSNETQAIPFLEKVLEIDPQNLDVIHRLKEIYRKKHNMEQFYSVSRRELPFLKDTEKEKQLVELGTIAYEKLYRFEDSFDLFADVLKINNTNEKAVEILSILYPKLEKWDLYVSFLEKVAERETDSKKKIELLERMGQISFDRLNNFEKAKKCFQEIVSLAPDNTFASSYLDRIYISTYDFAALESMYSLKGDYKGYIALLSGRLDKEESPQNRAKINFEIGRVYESILSQKTTANKYYEQSLSLDPSQADLARKLIHTWEESRNTKKLLWALSVLADNTGDKVEKREVLLNLFNRYKNAKNYNEAFRVCLEAFKIDIRNNNSELLSELISASEETGNFQKLASELSAIYKDISLVDFQKTVLSELASIYKNKLLFFDEAEGCYNKLSELDPENIEVLNELQDIAIQKQNFSGLENIYLKTLSVLKNYEEKRALYLKLGSLYEDILLNDEKAITVYEEILSSWKDDPEATAGLKRTYDRTGKYSILAELINREISINADQKTVVVLKDELANLLHAKLGKSEEAVEIFKDILSTDPQDVKVIETLENFFKEKVCIELVTPILKNYYLTFEKYSELANLLQEKIPLTLENSEKIEILSELSDVYELKLGSREAAFSCKKEQFVFEPTNTILWDELTRLGQDLSRETDLTELFGNAVGITLQGEKPSIFDDVSLHVKLTLKLAEIHERGLMNVKMAIRCYENVLSFEFDNLEVMKHLESLYVAAEEYQSLRTIYERMLELVSEKAEKIALHKKLAQILIDRLDQSDPASLQYQEILKIDGQDIGTINKLEAIYWKIEKWDSLIQLLHKKYDLLEDINQKAETDYKVASIYRSMLSDYINATKYLVRVLNLGTEFAGAIRELEEIIEDKNISVYNEIAPVIIGKLEPIYRKREDWTKLSDLLVIKEEVNADEKEKARIFEELARIYEEKLNDVEMSFIFFGNSFRILPENVNLLNELERIASGSNKYTELSEILEGSAEKASKNARRIILYKLSDIYLKNLNQKQKAYACMEKLHEIFPADIGIMKSMDSLLQDMGNDQERIPLLEQMASYSAKDEERMDIFFKIAGLSEKFGDNEKSKTSYAFVVEHRPDKNSMDETSEISLNNLINLYQMEKNHESVIKSAMLYAELCEDAERKKAMYLLASDVAKNELQNEEVTLTIYKKLFEIDPADTAVIESVKNLLKSLKKFSELEKFIKNELERAETEKIRVDLCLQLAHLFKEDMARPEDSFQFFSKAVEIDPLSSDGISSLQGFLSDRQIGYRASMALETAFEKSGNLTALSEILKYQVEHEKDVKSRNSRRLKLAWIFGREKLNEPEKADSILVDAFEDDPLDEQIFNQLSHILLEFNVLHRLIDLARSVLEKISNPQERIILRTRIGQFLKEYENIEGAIIFFRENLIDKPDDLDSISILEELYSRQEKFTELTEIMSLKADAVSEKDEKIVIYKTIASILSDRTGNNAEAIQYYEKILSLSPLEEDAFRLMELIMTQENRHPELKKLFEREINLLIPAVKKNKTFIPRLTEIRLKLCNLLISPLNEEAAALSILRDHLTENRDDQGAISLVEKLWNGGKGLKNAFDLLKRIYSTEDRKKDLLRILEESAESSANPAEKESNLRRAVEIAKSLEENEHLYNNLEKILFLIPEDQQIDEMLQETAKKISRVHDYTESYKKLFMEYSDRTSGIRIAMKLGNILENLEQNYEEASDFYRIVFDRDRSHTAARDALIANLQKQEKWFELGLLFEQVAEYSDSKKDKIHWFNNAASVFLEKAVDAEKATENYRAILKIDRSDIDALNGIEKLLREAGNYNELVKILDAKACLIKDRSALISVYSDLAQIYEDKLNDPDKIIIYHNEILKLNPSARESLLKLEKLYMQKEKFSNLDKLYSGWLDIAEEQKEKIEIFSKKSQILEAYLDKTDDAVFLLKEILKFEPTNRFALMRLDEIHQKRHEFADLAEILKLRLSVALDESEIITLNYRIAELFADKLNAPETSLEHIKTVIGCSPDHEDARKFLEKMLSDSKVAMPVSGLLEPIYEKRGQFEDLINLLFRRIELFSRNEDKISTYLKISDIAEKTCNDPSRAIDTLGSALRLQPDQEDILTGMQEIAGKHSMFQQMADCIEKVADETGPDQMKISLGYRLAEIYRNNLGKPDKAAKILKKALEISPSSELLLRSLRSIYMEIEDFQELSPVLGRLSAIAADERNAINMEHAKLLHHKLHNIENSVDIYSSLLKSEPESEEAAMELTSLCTDSIMGARVIDILKNFYSDLKNYKSLLDILKIELSISHDNVAQFEILVSIAEIYAEKLSNFSQAMEHYGSALALNPSATNLLAKMEEVAKAKNLFEDYAKWLKNALENAKWKDVRVEILQRLGDVAHNQLRNEALAEETFREVVSIVPMNIQALNALESIFETGGKYKELMEILSKKAQMHLSQDEKKRVHKRMSEIALLRHERQKAADYLEQIIFIDPDDKDTLIKLATIYETTKNIKKYAETLIKISNLSDTSEDKINNKLEAARIFKESLNDRKIAINLFEEVLSIDPQNLGAFAQLDFLYEEEQDFDKQKKLILKRAESITDSNEKCRLFMRLSDIAENKIKRVIDAIEYLKKVREIDSGYIEAIDQLIRIYFNEEMWEDYFKICINKSEIVKDRDEKVDLLLKSSELALEKLKDEEYAAQLIEKALQENPDHSTALRMLAHIKEDKNELDEALKIYQKLIESSPEDKEKVMALTGYAKAILRKDEYTEKALAMLNEALAIDPENLATMELMREYLFKTEQWNELIKILIREMKKILKDADKATKAVEIARIYREKLKNSQEFLRWIDEANRLKHDDPEIQRALVDYFLELNDTKRVIEPLEWLVNYLEGKKRFKDLPYYSYNLGKIFKETGNIEKAAEYFKLCYKHDTGNIENNLVLAGIYMDAKEFEKAQKIYQPMFLKVDNLKDNEKIEIFCSLAKIFFNEGDRKKAKQYITRALNIDPEHKESKELMGKL